MAGRGCTICITILGGTDSKSSGNEELSLPVALHSPLSVLKEQLEELTGIAAADQVVILCDLTDVERNNDKLLEGRDYMSLLDCGIKNGAVMTLHALGLSAERYASERKLKMQKTTKETTEHVNVKEEDKKRTLETRITAAGADHSYNGVLFDVKCNGPFEVDLLSVSVGGMLGRVRIFARDRPCEADRPEQGSSPHWWAHRESVSNIGWTVVADVMCRPSWDKPLEIKFNQPVTLLPHQQRGLYCHSSLPDDLGIQYQSYQSKESIVAANEHITLLAGLGHTGFEPFDEQHGWYRAWRGLSGSVSYRTKWKGWSPLEHRLFPADLKRAVRAMLLCQNRVIGGYEGDSNMTEESETVYPLGGSSSCTAQDSEAAGQQDRSQDFPPICEQETGNCSALQLHLLPKYLVYNILEYMHWDWFIGLETKRAAVQRAKMYAARALLGQDRAPQRSNCLPGPISVPLSMLGDMTAAGQEHQMMLMIAQAISSGQQTINIGGMTLQLSQGGDHETGSTSTSSGLMLNHQDEESDDDEYENIDEQEDDDGIDEVDEDDEEHEGLSAYFEERDACSDSDDDDDADNDSSSGDSSCASTDIGPSESACHGTQMAMHMQEEQSEDDDDDHDEDSSDDVVSLT